MLEHVDFAKFVQCLRKKAIRRDGSEIPAVSQVCRNEVSDVGEEFGVGSR